MSQSSRESDPLAGLREQRLLGIPGKTDTRRNKCHAVAASSASVSQTGRHGALGLFLPGLSIINTESSCHHQTWQP